MRAQMTEIRQRFPCYACRRMTHALRRAGWCINHKRVRRLLDPLPVGQRRVYHFIPHTTAAQHAYCRHPNLLLGRTLHHLNEAWVADLTYVRPPTTFLYLACTLDAYSRRCIGWALTPWLDTRVTLAALEHAVALRQPAPGLIHHSDQGVQYASNAYIVRLRHIGAQFSMALAGNSYENALIESFFKTLRSEESCHGSVTTPLQMHLCALRPTSMCTTLNVCIHAWLPTTGGIRGTLHGTTTLLMCPLTMLGGVHAQHRLLGSYGMACCTLTTQRNPMVTQWLNRGHCDRNVVLNRGGCSPLTMRNDDVSVFPTCTFRQQRVPVAYNVKHQVWLEQ